MPYQDGELEPLRNPETRAAGRALLRWAMRHLSGDPRFNLVIMGDFNEGHPVDSDDQALAVLFRAKPPIVDTLKAFGFCNVHSPIELIVPAVLAQQFRHVLVAKMRRRDQGRLAVVGLGVDLGFVVEEQFANVPVASGRRPVQGREAVGICAENRIGMVFEQRPDLF